MGQDKVFLSAALWWYLERSAPHGGMVSFSRTAIKIDTFICTEVQIDFQSVHLVQRHAIRSFQSPRMRHLDHTKTYCLRTACRNLWWEVGVRVPMLTNVDRPLHWAVYPGSPAHHRYCSQYRTPLETSLLHPFAPLYKRNPSCTSPVLQSPPGCPSLSYSELL